jgi:hypothetical protein
MNEATKAVVKALEEVRARYKMRQKMDKSGWELVDTGELLCDDYRVIVDAAEHNDVARKWHEQCAEHIAYAANESLTVLVGELCDALAWVLPMAKGYAAANRVGNNQKLCEHADDILTKAKALQSKNEATSE